jgi:hypothetical protein
MVYGNISKEKAINIVSKILCKNDPAGLCINDAQGDEYISEAKALADELDKKSNFFFFWIDIHDVILNKLGKDINKKLCKKIAHEIDESFSLCSFAENLRGNPTLKNIDDDLCLTIHDYFIVKFEFPEKVSINGEYFCSSEEQDIEDELVDFVIDDEAVYVLYSQKYNLFKKSHIRVCYRSCVNIDDLIKNNKVLMIFDNKSLIYKRNRQ